MDALHQTRTVIDAKGRLVKQIHLKFTFSWRYKERNVYFGRKKLSHKGMYLTSWGLFPSMWSLHGYRVEWCYITHVKNGQQSQYMEFLIWWAWKKEEIFSLKWRSRPFWTQINRYWLWNPRSIMFPPIPLPHSILNLSLQISGQWLQTTESSYHVGADILKTILRQFFEWKC